MKKAGRENANWGFRMPKTGWHTVCALEGIEVTTNPKTNKQSIMVPTAISEDGEDNGLRVTIFIPYKDENGEFIDAGMLKAQDFLLAVGLEDKFIEKFPGETSIFDTEPFNAFKIKVPGTYCKVRLDLSGDGKFVNVMEIADVSYEPAVETTPKKTGAAPKGSKATSETTKVEW